MMVSITDEISDHGTVTVDKDDVAETIRPWFPEPTAEVTEAIDKLQEALTRREYTEGWETYLGIKIKPESTHRACGWAIPERVEIDEDGEPIAIFRTSTI